MCAISEALGLSPSGAASIPAYHNDRLRMAEYTGERIVDLVINHITARQILTIDAIENAIILANATGGSTNTIIHLTALGHELGYSASQIRDLFEARGRDIPQIVKINPSAAANTDDLFRSGGIRQVLKELRSFLHKDCMTVEGISMGEVLDSKSQAAYVDRDVLRTVDDPFSVGKGLAVLYGNLAPDSCITKPAAIADTMQVFTGRAKVFNSEEEAAAAILSAQIQAGDLLVIRYEGPKGGPGMREMCNVMKYLHGLGLGTSTAVITDGRFSGTNNGCFVGHISPEAAEGGPIAAVQNGDMITIDIPARTITLHVEMKEIEHRLRQIQMPKSRFQEGYLAFYSKHATSAAFGAVLD